MDFQTRVRARFAELQRLDSKEATPWHVVNAAQTMDEVEGDVWKIVHSVLEAAVDKEQRPLGKLWENHETVEDDGEGKLVK